MSTLQCIEHKILCLNCVRYVPTRHVWSGKHYLLLLQYYFEQSAPGSILDRVYRQNMLPHGDPFFDSLERALDDVVRSDGAEAIFNTLVGNSFLFMATLAKVTY